MSNTEPPEYYERMVKRGGLEQGVMDEPKPVFCSECGYTPHRCGACLGRLGFSAPEIHDGVNRFGPFEALDTINRAIPGTRCGDEVRSTVHALRAYITGMER